MTRSGDPLGDPVHVERGVGEGAEVELLGCAGRDRDRAVVRELVLAGGQPRPGGKLLRRRRRRPLAERIGQTAVRARKNAGEGRDERVRRVERRRTEQPRVHVSRPGADADVEIQHPANADREGRLSTAHHPAVEDQRGVGRAVVRRDPLDDRVAADLLLAVECEAHVDRERALLGELADGLDHHEHVPLVVGDAARVETAVARRQLEGRGAPQLERVGRLHVEVRVAEDGGRAAAVRRCGELADDERTLPPGHELGGAPAVRDPRGDPVRRSLDVAGVRRVGTDGRDRDELGESRAQVLGRRSHGDESSQASRSG